MTSNLSLHYLHRYSLAENYFLVAAFGTLDFLTALTHVLYVTDLCPPDVREPQRIITGN